MIRDVARDKRLRAELDADQQAALDRGRHDSVARELDAARRFEAAGWVREQIWEFLGAAKSYLRGGLLQHALRTALEVDDPQVLEEILLALERDASPEDRATAAALLQQRRRDVEAARLLAVDGSQVGRAEALLRAGDRIGAANLFAEAGEPLRGLSVLGKLGPAEIQAHALAARLSWDLGDAEGTARHAQAALRRGDDKEITGLLARALGTLGHDLAAQMVLEESGAQPQLAPVRGRYHVTGTLQAHYAGAAYVGLDRLTHHEIEVHLLLADFPEHDNPAPELREALARFAHVAQAAADLGHPAIRPIHRIDPDEGLLVLPRAEGESLRSLIRPPGLGHAIARARALLTFLLDGLAIAHGNGLVHGAIYPTQIFTDHLGRPQLGPFGAHFLAGLVATRTGSLEEVLTLTAPEVRSGKAPTPASDVYAVGQLYRALLSGSLDPNAPIPEEERAELEMLVREDEGHRPTASEARALLRTRVADVTRLGAGLAPGDSVRARVAVGEDVLDGIAVVSASRWTDELLDMLCASSSPWFQTILDRDGRDLVLSPWPPGCARLAPSAAWDEGLRAAIRGVPDALQSALEHKLDGASIVQTPGGDHVLALDQVLAR